MIPLVKSIVHALLWDPMAARRWFRGFLLWAATAGGQVAASGLEAAEKWTAREWAIRLLVAGLAGVAGLINLGDKNPKPEGQLVAVGAATSVDGGVTWTSRTPPRGFALQAQIVFLLLVGFALFLYAMAHLTGAQ